MNTNYFKFDYDLNNLKKVKVHNFEMWITPRYLHHYKQSQYEPFSTQIINNYLKDGATFVDIGAHYGYYSILANKSKKKVEVISIEPVKENFEILKKNLDLNGIKKTSIHNLAVSDQNGIREFNVTEASDSCGFYQHPLTKSKKKIKIKTSSVDNLLKDRKIDFVKIDVEGHELSVLSGMKKTIARNKELKMLIEFNPKVLENAGFKPQELITTIEKNGFDVYLLDEHGCKYYRLTENIYSWDQIISVVDYDSFYTNLFCIKKEQSLLTTFFSHSSNLEGAERNLFELLQKMPQQGAICHLVSPSDGPMTKKLSNKAISVDIVPSCWWANGLENNNYTDLYSSLLSQSSFLKTLKKVNPHIIYSSTSVIPWGAFSAIVLGKPHVWHIREFGDIDHKLNYLTSFSEAKLLIDKLSDRIIYNSKAVKKHYVKNEFRKKDIVIYPGVGFKDLSSKKIAKVFKKSSSLKLVLAGAFRQAKGQLQAVEAVIELEKRGYNTELLLMGRFSTKDPFYKNLRHLVRKNNLKNVYFKNFVENPYPYIKQADVLLMCSVAEAFGRVTVEGMKLKKLVIGARSGATVEVIQHEKTGLLYKEGNIKDLANKIEFVIKNPNKIKKIIATSYSEAMAKYSTSNHANNVHQLLIELKTKNKKKFSNTFGLIGRVLQEMQRDHAELWKTIEHQKINIKKLSDENKHQKTNIEKLSDENKIQKSQLLNIKSAKFYKLWQSYCEFRSKIFRNKK